MPQTILGTEWFTEEAAAAILELPLDIVHRYFERMLADKRVPVAYHKGGGIPMLNGFTIVALRGRAQQPEQQPKLTISKRRHAR
jgi:hypothetical protein